MVSPVSEEIILVRVQREFVPAVCNITDPAGITKGLFPANGHDRIFEVVGDSVSLVGWMVGPIFFDFVGIKVGYGVGGLVVRCVI